MVNNKTLTITLLSGMLLFGSLDRTAGQVEPAARIYEQSLVIPTYGVDKPDPNPRRNAETKHKPHMGGPNAVENQIRRSSNKVGNSFEFNALGLRHSV